MPLITFEGTEGMGKSTQLIRLAHHLQNTGGMVILTRQPGGTPVGVRIRELLLDPSEKPVPLAELFLYLADRAQHVETILRPELEKERWILCDRYSDATIAYQSAGRNLPRDTVTLLNEIATGGLRPDLTFYFDGDPAIGLERARGRNLLDRIEQEDLAFFTKVRQQYLHIAREEPDRVVVINAEASEDHVWESVLSAFRDRFPGSG